MSKFPSPPPSRKAVRRAGKNIRDKTQTIDDVVTFNRWRDSHAYVLNTFQATLRKLTRPSNSVVGQRLKRGDTITDKLRTGRSSDLLTMHDLAGCRVIFESLNELYNFREVIFERKWEHERTSAEKYNYIQKPKITGYRGIHDVYKTKLRKVAAQPWSGLMVEIQYRTEVQHAWATAVEVADTLQGKRIKFDRQGDRFFQLCSEVLARKYEEMKSCLPDMTESNLLKELAEHEKQHGTLGFLGELREEDIDFSKSSYLVLILDEKMEVETFDDPISALNYRTKIEKERPQSNVVYVSAENPTAIKKTFQNYFKNTRDFVEMVRRSLDEGLDLSTPPKG